MGQREILFSRERFGYIHNRGSIQAFWQRKDIKTLIDSRVYLTQTLKIPLDGSPVEFVTSEQEQKIKNYIDYERDCHERRLMVMDLGLFDRIYIYKEVMHGFLSVHVSFWDRVDFCIEEAKRKIFNQIHDKSRWL